MKYHYFFFLLFSLLYACQNQNVEYVCTPCDLPCDTLVFSKPGICPHCKMDLIKKTDLIPEKELIVNDINIQNGSGKYLIEGGFQKDKTITIHYYKPNKLSADSPVILVLPGAGRNGNDYRDTWIEKAEEYNLLVLSPEYSEEFYPEFWSYNLAGMITDVRINEERTAMTGFNINENPDQWIFSDFDRIFDLAKKALQLNSDSYDMFGHSAGGQILHRLAIFNSESKADRILASNSGWYTVPSDNEDFPYGLNNMNMSSDLVDFSSKLILLLGEKDDASETRGHLRHSPEINKQGLHRLERGKYFFQSAKDISTEQNSEFKWELEIVPDIGHDYRGMSHAAADFLYKGKWTNNPGSELEFDKEKWQIKEGKNYPYREKMVNAIVYNDTIRTLTEGQLLEVLGEPDYFRDGHLYYRISETRHLFWTLKTKTMVIKIKDDEYIEWIKIAG